MKPGADPAAEFVTLSTLPSLLTREGSWGALCAALLKNESGTIDGAWGSSSALAVAALSQSLPGPLLVLVPGMADVAAWAEDLAGFTGSRPTLFPAFDSWPVVASKGRIAPETAGRLQDACKASPLSEEGHAIT